MQKRIELRQSDDAFREWLVVLDGQSVVSFSGRDARLHAEQHAQGLQEMLSADPRIPKVD